MKSPWFYTDTISAESGDRVNIHASSPVSPCKLLVSRVGKTTQEVFQREGVVVDNIPAPKDADENGCDWPVVASIDVGEHWISGYYDVALSTPDGETTHHFFCVRRSPSQRANKAVIVLTTNTYAAYNYWGGANSYANVESLISGELDPESARAAAIGRLSSRRPFAQGMFAPPPGAPRLVADEPRGMNGFPLPQGIDWIQTHHPTPYDGSAGFLGKWEHVFVKWAEEQAIEIDYVTDQDFETNDDVLDGYKAVLLVGHSEYWSTNGRRQVDAFVEQGGNLAVFSGNTSYWKVRWEDEGATLIAHKWNGETRDDLWSDPETRAQATHLWSHPAFDSPEASSFGLSFLYGGYHRLAMCAARGAGAFTIYDDEHWALEGADLFYGDLLGAGVPLVGYENDGCPISFGADGLPFADGGLGVPDSLKIIAIAPATLAEDPRNPFAPMIPPEQPDVLAKIAYGSNDTASLKRLMRGHAVMASFTKGKGEVFNSGTTEWAHGLGAGDAFVEAITKNVLARFGAI